jgi:tRNA-2-methylthio-N6-dimethylallyladenosine synthase
MAMKRGHTVADYRERIARLRAARPDVRISSDFIIGFPGETESDFENTMQLIEDIRFDQSFSFVYSPRPGTPAASLTDDTPQAVKHARLQRLQQVNESHAQAIGRAMVGTTQPVLVEGPARKGGAQWCGRASDNRVVNFDAPAGIRPGDLLDILITDAMHFTLKGRVVADPATRAA